ncbi:type IV secretion protein DotU [Photobacterium damselae subsp. damselae]|uniref:type IVB secretion system protein IcmH/DotU n=1 Tax=Photobacterium damselae TaxID=38293 RepID=UPI000D0622ED|nr:type IVB secretion system protein IcmH/DotU [Photobacterium damselae]NVH47153.1 DotU family type IV/VI secretion system protein [Photobacterium damselae subsp. damselae]PSB76870.1 type IV secretion protein DotU [Photobacterium damselae subsp. damselae]
MDETLDREKATKQPEGYFDGVLFDNVKNINQDQDFWFKLRGNNINALIDAATPLLGMSLRIRNLSHCDNIDEIYHQSVEEIKAIEVELTEAGYEHAVILAYRYVLCSFIDEAVMSTPWGADSSWAECSLLTRFHNETWGGEKVFSILSRLESEPARYQELLAFIYLCLTLGFEGRYKVMNNGKEEFEKVVANLYEILRRLADKDPEALTSATEHVVATKYKLTKQVPIWTVFAGFALTWAVIFIGYSIALHNKSGDVLEQLNQILQ